MSIIDVWGNSFVPLLAGIPLLILLLFACCTCVDKTITASRRSWLNFKCKPRTPRRVRFDCEAPHIHSSSPSTSYSRISRSSTSPRLCGLMAHSSYVQRNSNYRYNSVVYSDRAAAHIQARTVLDRNGISSSVDREPGANPIAIPNHNAFGYHANRRSSIPTPTGPNPYYAIRPKSPPVEPCGNHLDAKQRRYSTPSSPTVYAHNPSPRSEESNYSSISCLPEVRAYLQFMEIDPTSRQRSQSFSGRNSSRNSSRRSSRRSSRHHPRSRSPSPYALERTAMISASDDMSNYSCPSSYGKYLTPQGSSDQGSFKSPVSGTPDWLDNDEPPTYEDCLSNLSRSSSIKTSFI